MSDEAELPRVSALTIFAEGFSAPLVLMALVGGAVFGYATFDRAAAHADVAPAGDDGGDAMGDIATPGSDPGGPAPEGGPEPLPADGASEAEVEARIDAGDLATAEAWAEAMGYETLAARAYLLHELSRRVRPSAVLARDDLVSVVDDEGVAHVGVVRAEGDPLRLELYDGQAVDVPARRVRERTPLDRAAALEAVGRELRATRAALGEEPSGLAAHRLAYVAFASGLPALGVELLEDALRTDEGPIIIDMFGAQDFERLHWARQALFGPIGAPPTDLAAADHPGPEPELEPATPVADPTPAPVDPEPQPVSEPDPVRQLERDPVYRQAELAYRTGIELYRQSYGASLRAGAVPVKGALREFRRAQDLLDGLLDRYGGQARGQVERRLVELNTLVLDCTKRLGTFD